MIGILGVVISLALLILLALRGVNIFIASIVASIVAAVTNLRPLNEALMTDFSQSMMGFAGNFFLLFITGAVFGRMMGESRAAASIARYLGERMGMDRALLIIIISTALLTYGGVNAFIVIFTLYPLGLWLVYRANLPKRLLLGAAALGAGTFTMTAMPGAPSIHNNISADALGTSLLAGPWIGLSASAIMFLLGWIYLEREKKKALGRGECFEPGPSDHLSSGEGDAESLPDWRKSSVPMIAVLGWILIPGAWARLQPPAPSENGLLVLSFSQQEPILWTCLALTIGTLLGLILFRHELESPRLTLGRGAESAILPLFNTAAVIGFGGVVRTTAIFAWFSEFMLDTRLPPLISAALSINIVSGLVGSASGGLGFWMPTFGAHYIEAGVSAETLHRIVTIASGGLDSLPHCGAVITYLTVMGLTHRQGYRDMAMVTLVVPLVATVIVTLAVMLLGS